MNTTYSSDFTPEQIKEIEAFMAKIPNTRMNHGCPEPHEFDDDSILKHQNVMSQIVEQQTTDEALPPVDNKENND